MELDAGPCHVYVPRVTPPPRPPLHRLLGFFNRKVIFAAYTQAGSDVTGPSSSSGLGSSLAPEILLRLPVVLGEMEEVWSQQTQRPVG